MYIYSIVLSDAGGVINSGERYLLARRRPPPGHNWVGKEIHVNKNKNKLTLKNKMFPFT